jgi:type IX secretion system PorP/SprF family membrane protein
MKSMIKKILTAMILMQLSISAAFGQQDAQFSQYMFNGIFVNPAYAGYREQLNVHAFFRSQWTGINGAPQTMSVAVDAIANNGNVGLALQLSNDRIGAQRNMAAYANYAYRLRLNEEGTSRLALGFGFGAIQLGINGALLEPNYPEEQQPMGMESTIVPDARAGVFFSDERFYAGFSVDNLISQYIDIDRYSLIPKPKVHYYLTAGTLVPLSQDVMLKPSFLLRDDRGGPTSLDLSSFLIFKDRLWVGGSYRTGVKIYDKKNLQKNLSSLNSAVAAVQLFPSADIRIGYAYDFSIGPLKGYSGGTHEISISYFFNKRNVRMLSPRYF